MVFAYRETEGAQRAGVWYALVPIPGPGDAKQPERDVQLERELEAKLADALPIERHRDGWLQFREAPF